MSVAANRDIERAVLAACLRESDFARECVAGDVCEEMFYHEAHAAVWRAVVSLSGRGLEVDELTVEEFLAGTDELEVVGGRAYLLDLGECVESVAFAGSWVKTLKDLWKRRKAARASRALVECAEESATDFAEVQERMAPHLTALGELAVEQRYESTAEVFDRSMEHYDAWATGEESRLDRSKEVVWGISDLDERMGSFNPVTGDFLVLLGGESSWGKSSLARQMAVNNLYKGKRVLLFLLETSRFNWPAQAASQRARVNLRMKPEELDLFRREKDGQDRLERFAREMRLYRQWAAEERLFVDESCTSAEQIVARTRMIASKTGRVDLVVVDYLQEMAMPQKGQRPDVGLHENCRRLKELAKELSCPLLLLSSINTDFNKEYGPGKWDFRGSRDITYAADLAFQLFRPAKDAADNEQPDLTRSGEPRKEFHQKLMRVKGRDTGTGFSWIKFAPRWTLFSGLPRPEARGRKPHSEEFTEALEF